MLAARVLELGLDLDGDHVAGHPDGGGLAREHPDAEVLDPVIDGRPVRQGETGQAKGEGLDLFLECERGRVSRLNPEWHSLDLDSHARVSSVKRGWSAPMR